MEDFRIEYYIDSGDGQITELSSINEKETEWKKDMEERALSEYYNKKIKVSKIKI